MTILSHSYTGYHTGLTLLQLLMRVLVALLLEPSAAGVTAMSRRLHDTALQRLMRIGPQYPVHFRNVMHTCPELKQRLEAAVKVQQAAAAAAAATAQQRHLSAAAASAIKQTPAKPSIQLKMDFSNFGSGTSSTS